MDFLGSYIYIYIYFKLEWGNYSSNGTLHCKATRITTSSLRRIVALNLRADDYREVPMPDYFFEILTTTWGVWMIACAQLIIHPGLYFEVCTMKENGLKESWSKQYLVIVFEEWE